jgi:hypothetical protein
MRGRVLAWSTLGLTTVMAVTTVVFAFIDDGTKVPVADGGTVSAPGQLSFAVMVVAFAVTGAVVASRRPDNAIGWLLCISPLFLAATGVADGWYQHAVYGDPGSLPVSSTFVWVANWAWIPGFPPLITLLFLLFPDGRPPSRRWGAVIWLTAAAMAFLTLGYMFAPGELQDYARVQNPFGLEGTAGDVATALVNLGFPLLALAAVLSVASLVVRFRRAAGVERQQVKWVAAAAALVLAGWIVNAALDGLFDIQVAVILPIILLALPAATAVAVLRYRLYDLGLVIHRTLVYALLTATLGASYLGLVLLLQLALDPVTSGSSLAVAVSTLAVAALFRPARNRIQAIVDRRFYRRRYDAARTLETFGARLRDEVELETLGNELRAVVHRTMQPAHVSLWLRSP